jgi:uncharacterized tellurite resistance protein B-like protein
MLDILKRFFSIVPEDDAGATSQKTEHDIRVATCALFVEIARIDETFTRAEMEKILSIVKEKYGLAQENASALLEEAEKELKGSIDLWQFTSLINANYSVEEKIEVIETLWQIVYVDGKLDRYEHYLMSKLKTLFHLSQDQLIDAKLKVLSRPS